MRTTLGVTAKANNIKDTAIASKISPIGVGNDMFGSVRIPAAFNGVCGLLVSAYKLPLMNATS